jgi:hypothetical protein
MVAGRVAHVDLVPRILETLENPARPKTGRPLQLMKSRIIVFVDPLFSFKDIDKDSVSHTSHKYAIRSFQDFFVFVNFDTRVDFSTEGNALFSFIKTLPVFFNSRARRIAWLAHNFKHVPIILSGRNLSQTHLGNCYNQQARHSDYYGSAKAINEAIFVESGKEGDKAEAADGPSDTSQDHQKRFGKIEILHLSSIRAARKSYQSEATGQRCQMCGCDPCGVHLFMSVAEDVAKLSLGLDAKSLPLSRLAVTPEQADETNLPTAPAKTYFPAKGMRGLNYQNGANEAQHG